MVQFSLITKAQSRKLQRLIIIGMKKVTFIALMLALVLAGFWTASPMSADAQSALAASISLPANGSSFKVGDDINFHGMATGGTAPYSYVWNFGDGIQRFGQTPSISYSAAGTKTVTLTVNDWNDVSATTSITLNITGSSSEDELVISNIRVTNITQTGVTILWDTNLPANSRVIYDTVSHPDISGASAPNYGYAASTSTTDNDPKVTSHSVTLSGLNPGTRYYFRVISE